MEGKRGEEDGKLGRDSESEVVFAQRRRDLPDASVVAFMMMGLRKEPMDSCVF